MRERLQRLSFRFVLAIKLVDGILDLVGGVLLWAISPETIGQVTRALTQHELTEDPRDFVATHLMGIMRHLTSDVRLFAILFLLVHGLAKIALMAGLWTERLRFFPWAIGFLGLFIGYQIYRVSYSHSTTLAGC